MKKTDSKPCTLQSCTLQPSTPKPSTPKPNLPHDREEEINERKNIGTGPRIIKK